MHIYICIRIYHDHSYGHSSSAQNLPKTRQATICIYMHAYAFKISRKYIYIFELSPARQARRKSL